MFFSFIPNFRLYFVALLLQKKKKKIALFFHVHYLELLRCLLFCYCVAMFFMLLFGSSGFCMVPSSTGVTKAGVTKC